MSDPPLYCLLSSQELMEHHVFLTTCMPHSLWIVDGISRECESYLKTNVSVQPEGADFLPCFKSHREHSTHLDFARKILKAFVLEAFLNWKTVDLDQP